MTLNSLLDSGFANLTLLEAQYALYQKDKAAVDSSWKALFDRMENSSTAHHPATTSKTHDRCIQQVIDTYRTYGHLMAHTNPLDLSPPQEPDELHIEHLGISDAAAVEETIKALKTTYCDKIGIEYIGLHNTALEQWIQQRIEPTHFKTNLTTEQKQMILQQLNQSELFEAFLHTKFVGQKRFSLEGSETLIPMLASLVDQGAAEGIKEFVIGMAHRGRLNVLRNIFDKSHEEIFSEFEEGYIPTSVEGSGDVKYHKGFYSEIKTVHGHHVKLTLVPNPSHLESVDPVVEGQTRAKQLLCGDVDRKTVLPILIHGDAAISGQGVVYETMQLCHLQGYTTGGTIHVVVNNQIGFTTLPRDGRSTTYCTDIAHAFGAPVFHVNAEDPEGCVYVMNLALGLRQEFQCDVFIELNCYRKYGHNEGDEPGFTQPQVYQIIRQKQPIRDLYRDMLIRQGAVEKSIANQLETSYKAALQAALNNKKGYAKTDSEDLDATLSRADGNKIMFQKVSTAVPLELLQVIGQRLCEIPASLHVHSKLVSLTHERLEMLKEKGGRPIDWGMGELLAYGSLLWDGVHVRLSGQDSCRGTFSHRHALLVDQVSSEEYVPLQHLKPSQGVFEIYNSPLSEYAALGFEFGYSVANPNALTLWEAQFGDFCNTAQVIIDQYITTAEQKWSQTCPLTLLLPHGYEGQGPEHSSGRMERFLTLAGNGNIQVVNPTTPAQLFHVLRRQIVRPLRKPLIVFTPKALLRYPKCVSQLGDFTHGAFTEVLEDPTPPKNVKRLILCSGRIYYDLQAEREKLGVADMAIVRLEQLYPFDEERLKSILASYSGLTTCIWAQEEPCNMGAWNFVRPLIQELLSKHIELKYIGRARSAASAVGSHAVHKREHTAILQAIFGNQSENK